MHAILNTITRTTEEWLNISPIKSAIVAFTKRSKLDGLGLLSKYGSKQKHTKIRNGEAIEFLPYFRLDSWNVPDKDQLLHILALNQLW